MARSKKNSSTAIETAQTRAAAIEAFDTAFDVGSGVSLTALKAKTTELQTAIASYNTKLSEVDALYNVMLSKEKELNTLNARILAGIGVKYGKDSNEYEQAGGTRTSEIKRKPRSSGTAKTEG